MIAAAAERFGYQPCQVRLRLYAGKFAAHVQGLHEQRDPRLMCCADCRGGPIEVIGITEVITKVLGAAAQTQYRDNAVLVTTKILEAAGLLKPSLPPPAP